eukprot:g36344.t1
MEQQKIVKNKNLCFSRQQMKCGGKCTVLIRRAMPKKESAGAISTFSWWPSAPIAGPRRAQRQIPFARNRNLHSETSNYEMTTITQHEFDTLTRVCKYCGKDSKDATPTNCFQRSIQASTDLVELKTLLQQQQAMLQEQQTMLQEQQTMLLLVAQSAMDPWGKTSTHRTESESETERNLVTKYYGLPGRRRCQILTNLSRRAHPHVVNLHIWPEHAAASLSYHGLKPENVNSPRNILRVNRSIERKFDNKELTFELRENQLRLKVLINTFRQVDGKPLFCPNDSLPFRRLLAAHSIQSHRLARAKGWIADYEQTDAQVQAEELARHSLDKEAQYACVDF